MVLWDVEISCGLLVVETAVNRRDPTSTESRLGSPEDE